MTKLVMMKAIALSGVMVVASVAPQAAQAGGAERFRQCLEESALKPNERRARSECMWKHWEYMASYGP